MDESDRQSERTKRVPHGSEPTWTRPEPGHALSRWRGFESFPSQADSKSGPGTDSALPLFPRVGGVCVALLFASYGQVDAAGLRGLNCLASQQVSSAAGGGGDGEKSKE